MSAPLGVVNVITEAQYVLVELIHILECHFHRDAFTLAGKENDIMNGLLGTIHVFYEADNAFRLMVCNFLRFFFSLIFKNDGKLRVQISGLMETALDLIFLETCLIKNSVVRQEVDRGTGLSGLADNGKQPLYQIHHGNTTFITVLIDASVALDPYSQSCGKCIYYGGTYTVQTTAGLVSGIIEFASGMQSREYQTLRADSFFVHSHGNTTSVIFYRGGAIRF